MTDEINISAEEIDALYVRLDIDAVQSGYHLNPDVEFTKELVLGLIINQRRYGYQSCPCRLASAVKDDDLDIICPCDYRDQDVTDYDTCYCGLYVSQSVVNGEKKIGNIPERRPAPEERKKTYKKRKFPDAPSLTYPVWRCRVCGYLCARENPPAVCPICKAEKERFEKFIY